MLYSQDQTWASEALERFLLKMTVMRERACTKIPYTTKNGKYDDNSTLAAEKSMGIGYVGDFWGIRDGRQGQKSGQGKDSLYLLYYALGGFSVPEGDGAFASPGGKGAIKL